MSSTIYDPARHNVVRVSSMRLLTRALGVSFFSLLSLALAYYAFLEMPQVHDLLFDAKPYVVQDVIYWAGFYFVGIFFWALPLVFTARLLLLQNFDIIGVDTEERFRFIVFRLPSMFAVFAFVAVLLGLWFATTNLPIPETSAGALNAAEIPLRQYLERHLIALFIATGGVLVLVIVRNFFLLGYGKQMEHLETVNPERFKRSLIRFEKLARNGNRVFVGLDMHLSAYKPDFLSMETWVAAQRVKVFMWRYMVWLTFVILALVLIHFISYSSFLEQAFSRISTGSKLDYVLGIVADTVSMKRAVFLFMVFGAWLPFVTFLALMSNRHQFPFIFAIFVAAIALTVFLSDGHDTRLITLKQPEQQAALKPITFNDSVSAWKEASGWVAKGCESLPAGSPGLADCPRPIIAVGEGGGSRAAFLFASVLGNLEDRSLDQLKNDPTARPFHKQLFAISSVSGSSVGAAFYVSALKTHEAARQQHLDALKTSLYLQRLWFLNVANAGTDSEKFLKDEVTYKDALQAALSNDFLSPVMMAYLARDVSTISRLPIVMDRAGAIEVAWEDTFNDIYGLKRDTSPLAAPLQTFSPSSGAWTPLLFLNATSMETGRRIIATPVKINTEIKPGKWLFQDTYDLHELICSAKEIGDLRTLDRIARLMPSIFSQAQGAVCNDGKPVSVDVRLSTAVSMSARSPFVSPHANIRDRNAQIVDSAVDGGYFDNSGAVTALEIASGIKAVDPRLKPFLLQISNEPEWFPERCQGTQRSAVVRPPLQDESDLKPLGTFGSLLTVNATRVARAYETIVQAPVIMRDLNDMPSDAQIYVCPQRKENFLLTKFTGLFGGSEREKSAARERRIMRKIKENTAEGWKSVSLSWWLSPPLQAYLDGQIYAPYNEAAHGCVLSLLTAKRAPGADGATSCR